MLGFSQTNSETHCNKDFESSLQTKSNLQIQNANKLVRDTYKEY